MLYDDRKLHSVEMGLIHPMTLEDGETFFKTAIHINVTDPTGEFSGPGIDLEFGFPGSPDDTLISIRARALERAHALLQRVAREGFDDLQAAFERSSAFPILKN